MVAKRKTYALVIFIAFCLGAVLGAITTLAAVL
jgi:hypothetical protein